MEHWQMILTVYGPRTQRKTCPSANLSTPNTTQPISGDRPWA